MQALPLPARLVPWPKAPPTTLMRCVWLAALLHVWLVLSLGSAPGGTARQGQGVWGAINVTLRGPVSEGSSHVVAPPTAANAAPGAAAQPRWGGAVRQAPALPDSEPGAAQLGAVAAQVSTSPSALASPQPAPPAPALASPPAPPAGRVLQERSAAPAVPPLEPTAIEPMPALPAARPLPPVPDAPAPALPTPATAQELIALPPPLARIESPLQQAPAAAAVAAPLPRVSESMALPALPALATPPSVAQLPAPSRRLQSAPAPARAAEPALSGSAELPAVTLPSTAVPGAALPAARSGAFDAGERVGHDVATPAAAPASAAPRLNLQLARPRGGELSRYSTSGVLPVLPRPPERDDKLAREIEKAAKTDCRAAYAAMGPLAVIPLALDAVRKDGGCKW